MGIDGRRSLPTAAHGSALTSTLLLAGESAAGLRVSVERLRLEKFAKAVRRALPLPPQGRDVLIGIEAAKGLGEAAPGVIAYATDVKHVGF